MNITNIFEGLQMTSWERLKAVYRHVLVYKCKIEYLGDNIYEVKKIIYGQMIWSYTLNCRIIK